ncbi:hypothetical protein D3C76_782330 [compost metagenome]
MIELLFGYQSLIDQGQYVVLKSAGRRHIGHHDTQPRPLFLSDLQPRDDIALKTVRFDLLDVAAVVPGISPPPFRVHSRLAGRSPLIIDVPVLIVDIISHHSLKRRPIQQASLAIRPLDDRLNTTLQSSR